jgi:hypothetical protein
MSVLRRAVILMALSASAVLVHAVATSAWGPSAEAAPPSTAYPPGDQLDVTVTNPEGPPGYPVVVVITGCVPGERVIVTIGDETIEVTCDGTTIQVTVTIPAPDEPGVHDVVVTFPDRDEPTTRRIPITVTSPDQPTTTVPVVTTPLGRSQDLPRSGGEGVVAVAWAAFAVLITGVGLVVVTRARTTKRSRPSGLTRT